jgi:predicted ester cyclase
MNSVAPGASDVNVISATLFKIVLLTGAWFIRSNYEEIIVCIQLYFTRLAKLLANYLTITRASTTIMSFKRGGIQMNAKDFAQKFVKAENEAWTKGNIDALDEVENSDVVYHLTPPIPDVVGRDAHKQFITMARKAFSDIKIDIKYLTGQGDFVGFLYNGREKYTGEFPGLPPGKGQEVVANELWLFRLKNGKVSEGWMYGTTTGLV